VPGATETTRAIYAYTFGIDTVSARLAESGNVVRFSYRVVDAQKAAPLHDRKLKPQMLDEQARAVLYVPEMDKVGPLRQAQPPESGRSYWMVFSNKGGPVQPGHRVSVVVGSVRIDGLVVH
jgi:hypothetical protein